MTKLRIQVPPEDAEPLTPAQMIALVRNANCYFAANEDSFYHLATLFEAIAGAADLELAHRLALLGLDFANTHAGECEDIAAIYISEAERAEKEAATS